MNSATRITKLSSTMVFTLLVAGMVLTSAARAGTLENLERERAIVVETMLDGALSPKERHNRIALAKPRLIDLERMVLRDNELTGRNTPTVRRAFKNYDLTFMASAALERNQSIMDNWLAQLGLTTQSLMATETGRH